MEKVLQQVRVARRRLGMQMFFAYAAWTLLGALTLAAIAVGVHQRYPSAIDPMIWNISALAAGLVLGLAAAAFWTWWKRPTILSAAAEIDRRFELRERISSSLALTPEEQQSNAGQALLADAVSKAQRIDVGSKFGVPLKRRLLLPIVPFCAALLLALVVQARETPKAADPAAELAQRKQIEKSTEDLRKRIEKRQSEASEKGLKEAEEALKELQKGLRDMEKRGTSERKKGLVELNKLTDKVAEQRKKMEGAEKVREQLRGMKDMKQGPADKLADALKKGNLGEAAAQLEKLKQQAQDGNLDKKDQEKLAEQLNQMQQKLEEHAQAQAQKKKDLQQQIDQAQQQGDQAAANRMQQQLDQMEQQEQQGGQNQRMQEMAQKLSQAANSMKQGNGQQAAESLQKLANDLNQMQKENDQLQSLDQTLEDIQAAKDAMNCDQCQGGGCKQCQGQGQGQKPGQGQGQGQGQQAGQGNSKGQGRQQQAGKQPGRGIGKGHIESESDGQEKDAGYFDTQVRQQVGKGASIIAGKADGPNAKGRVHDAIKAEFESKDTGPADPLINQRLPKSQRTHVEEYFESLREGQ
ncbi:MAG: hypothetical protein K8T91_06570 [Planctomycetes bacterium]|nr:hypothetical protein [Planctomycetota bacterium]